MFAIDGGSCYAIVIWYMWANNCCLLLFIFRNHLRPPSELLQHLLLFYLKIAICDPYITSYSNINIVIGGRMLAHGLPLNEYMLRIGHTLAHIPSSVSYKFSHSLLRRHQGIPSFVPHSTVESKWNNQKYKQWHMPTKRTNKWNEKIKKKNPFRKNERTCNRPPQEYRKIEVE